ncbi:outer membrane beta-barrel protein [Psychroserpens sp.]|uniref:outer membrane beta-barrel protein n=1 Tax=Psychroserpens sp. TaxID=2020870 RepID=UPI002B26A7D8|nr:outer membrane beta-barrel protein [Psychroserpens sp.]
MRNTFLVLAIFVYNFAEAQFIKEKSINAQIGYGISSPYDSEDDIANGGFFVQGELVLQVNSWLDIRPYLGLISTSSDGKDLNGNETDEKAESKAFFIGGKARIRIPIKWVAPYLELGIGTSIGKFETFTAFDDIEKNGIIHHIPLSIGLELGRNNNVDLAFTYYYQPSVKQFVGALALGVSIPFKSKSE